MHDRMKTACWAAAFVTMLEQAPPPALAAPAPASSLTDWLCGAILGASWSYLTGQDLLPAPGEGEAAALLDEESDPEAGGEPAAPSSDAETKPLYYTASGKHDMAGYYVKTVGNAPVLAPQRLTAAEAQAAQSTAAASPAASGSSAWNKNGGTWETRDTTAWATSRLPELATNLRKAMAPSSSGMISRLAVTGGDASLAVSAPDRTTCLSSIDSSITTLNSLLGLRILTVWRCGVWDRWCVGNTVLVSAWSSSWSGMEVDSVRWKCWTRSAPPPFPPSDCLCIT